MKIKWRELAYNNYRATIIFGNGLEICTDVDYKPVIGLCDITVSIFHSRKQQSSASNIKSIEEAKKIAIDRACSAIDSFASKFDIASKEFHSEINSL